MILYDNGKVSIVSRRKKLAEVRKTGAQLAIGDVLHALGGDRTITSFSEHPGLARDGVHYTARVANSGDWGITVFDDDSFVQIDNVCVPTHLVYHYRRSHGRS